MTTIASLLVRKSSLLGGFLPYKQNLLGAFDGQELVATFNAGTRLDDAVATVEQINGREL